MKKQKLFALWLMLLVGFTTAWANQTDLISGVTLPDIPETSLDMSSQTFREADDDGWIVMQPNADIRNAGVTWFTALAWNTTSTTVSDVSGFTAPFYTLNSVSVTTVRSTERTKAIRFTGATDISFLVTSGGSRTVYVALYSYDGTNQTPIETKSAGNTYTEFLFSDLSVTTDYIAYMYCSTTSNAVIAEIALKAGPDCTTPTVTFSAAATAYVGDEVTLTFSSTNENAVTYTIKKGDAVTTDASISDGKFMATAAGTYTITATQVADETNGICPVEETVTITVSAKAAVESASIEGPLTGFIGAELTYTATADNATSYAWYVNGVEQTGETTNEFKFTPATKGDYTIYATATNEFTATPVESNTISLTVTKLCGTLIKIAQNGQSAATITPGVFSGTQDVKLSSGTTTYEGETGRKIGSNIILSGGLTMLNGFYQRFVDEISHIVNNNPEFLRLKGIKDDFHVHKIIFPRNILTWVGASLFLNVNNLNSSGNEINRDESGESFAKDMVETEIVNY